MAFYGLIWSFLAILLCFMKKYRFDWTCIVFSRGHRSKFIWSCFTERRNVSFDQKISQIDGMMVEGKKQKNDLDLCAFLQPNTHEEKSGKF